MRHLFPIRFGSESPFPSTAVVKEASGGGLALMCSDASAPTQFSPVDSALSRRRAVSCSHQRPGFGSPRSLHVCVAPNKPPEPTLGTANFFPGSGVFDLVAGVAHL
jgi:hypothetical protein